MAHVLPYHPSLRDMLASPPPEGRGHAWMFKLAVHLRHYHPEGFVFRVVRRQADTWGRAVPDAEILKAVSRAFQTTTALTRNSDRMDWPEVDRLRLDRIRQTVAPIPVKDRHDIDPTDLLVAMFGANALVCVGIDQARAEVVRACDLANARRYQFVVPSAMSKPTGTNQDGKVSARCLDNTGPRQYLVVEADGTDHDTQRRVLAYLSKFLPLTLMVFSGGKSLHGWFKTEGHDERTLRVFMSLAVSLGGDPHTWTPSQFVRMPNGTRTKDGATVTQSIVHITPTLGF